MKGLIASLIFVALVVIGSMATSAETDPPAVRMGSELAEVVDEHAGVIVELPEVGFTWTGDALVGDVENGSVSAVHSKVIYYFVHWGPTEVDDIDEAYARRRIPELWPSEGLDVQKVEPAVVAGHPAVYAEAIPKRQFYRAYFLIWNCPETGRQFIADMNYNIAVKTPRAELEAELEATRKTLACHPGAPVTHLDSHPVRYENHDYRLSFEHPKNWFVFDNPFGVPHPAYAGFRSHEVGSVLAWLQDMEVTLRFDWSTTTKPEDDREESMGVRTDLLKAAVERARATDGVMDFRVDEYEVLRFGPIPTLKVVGTAEMKRPDQPEDEYVPERRLMLLVATDTDQQKLLVITVGLDFHRENGLLLPPHRSILDRWAVDLVGGLSFASRHDSGRSQSPPPTETDAPAD